MYNIIENCIVLSITIRKVYADLCDCLYNWFTLSNDLLPHFEQSFQQLSDSQRCYFLERFSLSIHSLAPPLLPPRKIVPDSFGFLYQRAEDCKCRREKKREKEGANRRSSSSRVSVSADCWLATRNVTIVNELIRLRWQHGGTYDINTAFDLKVTVEAKKTSDPVREESKRAGWISDG